MNTTLSKPRSLLVELLSTRLDPPALAWLEQITEELHAGVSDDRFCALLSMASRHAWRRALAPSDAERRRGLELVQGWDLERWTQLEALRVAVILARNDLDTAEFARAYEEAFRYADEGEQCALFRALALLPDGKRFAWRAGEGCRSNMVTVFQSVAMDSPYPAAHFGDVAWRQLVIKAIFIGAPLWRVFGLDGRLDAELARMALDLVDERRSAGRPIAVDLWLCLGSNGGDRGLAALEVELGSESPEGRRAAVFALARAGATGRLEALAGHADPVLAAAARDALATPPTQCTWAALQPA